MKNPTWLGAILAFVLLSSITKVCLSQQTDQGKALGSEAIKDGSDEDYLQFIEKQEKRKCDADPDIALQAAWELTLDSNEEKTPGFLLPRFFGFFEGRTKLKIPRRWEAAMARKASGERKDLQELVLKNYFLSPIYGKKPGLGLVYYPIQYKKTSMDFSAPEGTSLEKRDDQIIISVSGKTVAISQEDFKKAAEKYVFLDQFIADLSADRSYLALFARVCQPFPVACVDNKTGKTIWRARVWGLGNGFRGPGTGPRYHELMMVLEKNQVALFGITSSGHCYCESFDAESGKNIFRFNTDFSKNKE